MNKVKVKKDFFFSNSEEIKFILGPCQIESRSHALDICSEIDILSKKLAKSIAVLLQQMFMILDKLR